MDVEDWIRKYKDDMDRAHSWEDCVRAAWQDAKNDQLSDDIEIAREVMETLSIISIDAEAAARTVMEMLEESIEADE